MISKLIGTSLWLSFSLWIPPIVSSKRRSILMKVPYLLVLLPIQARILWLKMKVKIYPQPTRKQWRILKALIKHIKSNSEDLKEAQTLSTFLPRSISLQLVTKIWEALLPTKPSKSSLIRLLSPKQALTTDKRKKSLHKTISHLPLPTSPGSSLAERPYTSPPCVLRSRKDWIRSSPWARVSPP